MEDTTKEAAAQATTTEEAAALLAETATVKPPAEPVITLSDAKMAKVLFVKQHATDYVDAGWDVVLETMTVEEVAAVIGRARTMTGAVNAVREQVVEPWVIQLIETRPGSDDDEQLMIGQRLVDERKANWYDATARLRGEANTVVPPRKHARPVLPQVVEVHLDQVAEKTDGENLDSTSKDPELNAAAEAPKPKARTRAPRKTTASRKAS